MLLVVSQVQNVVDGWADISGTRKRPLQPLYLRTVTESQMFGSVLGIPSCAVSLAGMMRLHVIPDGISVSVSLYCLLRIPESQLLYSEVGKTP